MGTYTAQILIGYSHLYHGGIKPSHVLFLNENSRSAWILKSFINSRFEKVFICDPKNLIEDAILIITLFVLKPKKVLRLVSNFDIIFENNFIKLNKYFSPTTLKKLRQSMRNISFNGLKIIISIFDGSSLRGLDILENYKDLEFEVCAPFYLNSYCPFTNSFKVIDKTLETSFPFKGFLTYLKYLKESICVIT